MLSSIIPIFESSLEVGLIFSILAMGLMITYKVLDFYDLSLEGTFPLGAFLVAASLTRGLNPVFGLVVSMVGGSLGGLLTYLLYKKLKIEPLLSGILTMTILYSVNLRVVGASNVALFTSQTIFSLLEEVPKSLVLLALVLLVKFLIDKFLGTEQGYLLRATGDNSHLVRALGKDPDGYICLGLMLSNGLIAMSGAIMAQHQGFADSQMGSTMIVTGLASIIIGDTLLRNFRTIAITSRAIGGSIIYRLIYGLAIHLGLEPGDLKMVTALIVIVFIGYNTYTNKSRGGEKKIRC